MIDKTKADRSMTHATRILKASPTRSSALVMGVASFALALSACGGGSGMDGEYYDDEGRGKLTIEGGTVTYNPFECEDGNAWLDEESVDASGEINEDGTSVRWASDDEHIGLGTVGGTEPISMSEFDSGNVVTIGDNEFVQGDEDELIDAYSEKCS